MNKAVKRLFVAFLALLLGVGMFGCSAQEADRTPADLVVYGKIFTSEGSKIVEAFAVKDGKYVYVGDRKGAEAFVEAGKTDVVDYTGKGLVIPGCGNGHAHYMLGYALKTIGTTMGLDDTPEKFLSEIVPAAVKNAKAKGATAVFGHGWSFMRFKDNLPTRQQLDAICSDMPMYFLDDECHKALVNTALLVKAGILKEDGTAGKTEIRGGEIGLDANGIPTGYLVEQAQTYVRSFLDDIYTLDMATANVAEIERYMLSTGYTMYHEGWGNYFVNTNYYQAVKQLDEAGKLHFVLGLPYEFESWMNIDEALARAIDAKKFASKRVMPRWIKLLMDGTVETGTGFVDPLYPGGHQGIPNWTEEELTYITRKANENGLTMHIHVMGNKGVNCVVNAFVNGGKDEMRNALVHVHTVNQPDYKRMADHNMYVVASLHWHHTTDEARELLLKELPEGMGDKSYPIKSFFDYGITASSHSDYPALAGSPDDPFGIMEIAVTGIYYPEKAKAWWPEELITREQALTALTINVAKQMFIEDERGSIKEGKYADFLLVNKDVLTCPAAEIHTAKPEATYFEGKKVFSAESAEGAPDYSRKDAWCRLPEITKDVDTFFIYPTEYMGFGEGDSDYATIDNAEMRKGAQGDYIVQASAYADSTNVFMPYYRQAALRYAGEVKEKTGDGDIALSGMPYDDITAALDYYFKNYNNGRPFIIAGHSQGSAMTKLVLKKYFKEHPEYYGRMIAAYVIGYSVTKDDLEANPHLKFATGETDTGVIVSWNTEGPKNIETNAHNIVVLPGAISINPINWKLDDTYAPASENLGSLMVNLETGEIKIGDVGADAQVVPERGTVVTNAKVEAMPEELARVASEFFGPDGRHESDYSFYYNNIKANVAKRIAAYKAGKTDSAEGAPDYSRKDCWYQLPEIAKDVDTFFIYPTEYMGFNEGDSDYATLDNAEMRKGAEGDYIGQASVYEESTNVFVPYYRQAGMPRMGRAWKETGDCESAISGIPYSDITAALDYYFKNYNNGRPFIIAGHSQGSAIARLVLKKYFREHPDYYERMIAAYVIGYSVTKDDLKANPHLKFATGETDTGVIISWNTEGKGNVEANVSTAPLLPNAISINPLNWKLDDTYAPASENLGSLTVNEKGEPVIADIGADAQVVPERGTVVTNAKAEPVPEGLDEVNIAYFGPDGRHASDYSFYYNNIKANVARRIAAYKASQKNEFLDKAKAKERMTALYGENKKITDGNYDKSLAVKCVNGTFVGKKNEGVIAYRGIPFVEKQPVGELRWKAPVDVVPDDGIYEAYYNAKSPHQVESITEMGSLYYHGEDCLCLDIWKADEESAGKKPVMVWVHGGAFEMGGTADPLYEFSNFVRENHDVIVASIEYRLGVFGFIHLSHLPDGKDYPDAQNLGLMDQMMALKWIHENIATFGGDPDNVTIFGESAGGGSVTLLPLIEGSHKYFKRVISQSGSPVLTRSTEQAIECTNELMNILGCKTVADLQKVDVDKLVKAAGVLALRVWPERDGKYLPLDPYAAYANGAAKDIDFIQGCNKDELGYFISGFGLEPYTAWAADRKAKKLAQLTEEERALVESFCKDVKGATPEYSATSRLFDQIVFIAPLFRLSENQTKAGGKSYTYHFTVESSVPLMKSGHAVELATVLNHPEETDFTGRAFDETFSKTLRKMWVQFAKTGNPSLSAEISPDGKDHEWPLYDTENKQIMIFDEFNIHPEKESDRKILDWDRTYFLTMYYCI